MTNHSSDTFGQPQHVFSRRTALRTIATVGIGVAAGPMSAAAQSSGGDTDWEFDTKSEVYSSPTVVDSFVYVGNDDGSVYALNASNAYERWAFKAGDSVRSSPLVVDDLVFVGSNDAHLYALDAESGEEQWAFKTDGAIMSSPVVANKTAYVGSRDGNIYAINVESGRQLWTHETGGRVDSSPVVVDDMVFVGSYDTTLYALDSESGEQVWTFETGGEIQTSPTVANEMVYVSSEDANIYALGTESGEERWRKSLYRNGGLTAPTVAEGAYSRDTLFVSDNVRVHALNAAVGGSRWSTRFDGSEPVAPTVIDDHVFVGDDNLLALDTETGDELWSGGMSITSAPTGANDMVFVGSGDTVYSLVSGAVGSSEDSRVTLGTLGHHSNWRYAGQTLEIDTTPPEEEQAETSELDDAEGSETMEQAKNKTDTDAGGNETMEQADDERETTGTNIEMPGFGLGTTVAAVSGVGYSVKRRFRTGAKDN